MTRILVVTAPDCVFLSHVLDSTHRVASCKLFAGHNSNAAGVLVISSILEQEE